MLSRRSIETLIDLTENKLSQIIPFDRDDAREIKILQSCLDELKAGAGSPDSAGGRGNARIDNRAATH